MKSDGLPFVAELDKATMSDSTTMQNPTHLFFDEDGNTISYEEFQYLQEEAQGEAASVWYPRLRALQQQSAPYQDCQDYPFCEDDDNVSLAFRTPLIQTRFTFQDPKTLLMFFRFLESYNEQAYPEEVYMLPAIPREVVAKMIEHPDIQNPPLSWTLEATELLRHLIGHLDTSS